MTILSIELANEIDKKRQSLLGQLIYESPDLAGDVLNSRVEEAMFWHLPRDWSSELKSIRHLLWVPDLSFSLNAFSGDHDGCLPVHAGHSTAAAKRARQKRWMKFEDNFPFVKEIASALEKWGPSPTKPQRSKVAINGCKYLQWQSECSLIASDNPPRRTDLPFAAWRIRTRLLFPLVESVRSRAELLPKVYVEVLDSIEEGGTAQYDSTLFTVLTWLFANISSYAEDSRGTWSEPSSNAHRPVEYEAHYYFPYGNSERVQAFSHWYPVHHADPHNGIGNGDPPVRCSVSLGFVIAEDLTPPRKPVVRATSENHNFLLLDFELKNLVRLSDKCIHPMVNLALASEFYETYFMLPSQVLAAVNFSLAEYEDALLEHGGFEYLKSLASDADTDVWQIRDALIASRIPGGEWQIPRMRLLIDLASLQHRFELSFYDDPMGKFLDRNLLPLIAGGRNSLITLKAPATLCRKFRDIEPWAKSKNLILVHPKPGADAGSQYARLWQQACASVFNQNIFSGLTSRKPTTAEFLKHVSWVSDYYNGKLTTPAGDLQLLTLHLPESLRARTLQTPAQ